MAQLTMDWSCSSNLCPVFREQVKLLIWKSLSLIEPLKFQTKKMFIWFSKTLISDGGSGSNKNQLKKKSKL